MIKIDINNESHRETAVKMLREYCAKKGVSVESVLSDVSKVPGVVKEIHKSQNWAVRLAFNVEELTQLVLANIELLKKLV